MPEGDTLYRIASSLRHRMLDTSVRLTLPRVPYVVERVRVLDVQAHGKTLWVTFSDESVLYTHLRMTGKWRFFDRGMRGSMENAVAMLAVLDRKPSPTAVCFNAPTVKLLSKSQARRLRAGLALGPDILRLGETTSDSSTGAQVVARTHVVASLAERLRSRSDEVGVALLDQMLLAGIGNVYKSESLFACNIHPQTPCNFLSPAEAEALIMTAEKLMRTNVADVAVEQEQGHYRYQRTTRMDLLPIGSRDAGRSTMATRTTQSGCEVGKGPIAVYGREGRNCYECGTTIAMIRQGALRRSSYYCPMCQPLL
jgi:endonuclease VIII